MSQEIARAGGVSITVDDLVFAVKTGPAQAAFNEILLRRLAAARAVQEKLAATGDEVEEALSEFFAGVDAFEEPQIQAWLRERKLPIDAVRDHVREELLAGKAREHLVPDEVVEKRFHSALHSYASLKAEVIVFESEGMASEILLQLREGETDWARAADSAGGLESVELLRNEAPEEIAALLFSSAPGALVGPSEDDDGNHAIYRVVSKSDPELDDDLRERIRGELFTQEILRPLAKQPLTFA